MIKVIKAKILKFLYSVIARFIRENMGVGVTIEDNGNPNYRTLYVHLKIGNEVVAADYVKLIVKF